MSKTNKLLLLGLIIAVLFLGINAVKKTEPSSKVKPTNKINQSEDNLNTQENEGENVTVIVKPKTLKVGESPAFELEFETHSVDLSFDIVEQSSLINDKEEKIEGAVWDGSPPGGHHRSGILTFDSTLVDTKYVELILDDIAGVSKRKFRWNLL